MPKSMLLPFCFFRFSVFLPRQRGESPARKELPQKALAKSILFIFATHTPTHYQQMLLGCPRKYATVFCAPVVLFPFPVLCSCVGPAGRQQQTTGSQLGKPKSG